MDQKDKQEDNPAIITRLQAKLKAQQKTIDVLMNAAEQRIAEGQSSMALLSQNLNLERIVQQKTETLQRQGEQLRNAMHDLQLTQTQLLHAQKMESVGRLAAGIAHEINTPTQFIGSNIEFLEGALGDIRRLVHALQRVLAAVACGSAIVETTREAENLLRELDWEYLDIEIPAAVRQSREGIGRVNTIVRAMKEFSHPGGKDKSLHDLNRMIETTITVARNEWKYHAEMVTDFADGLPEVPCLADEIGQVILNLIINASHAIAEKNKDSAEIGKITISTRLAGDQVEIHIEDSGSGIPVGIRDRIFDPFFTTKPVGQGTGQGLAIAHDVIVKKHGGTITCTSEENQGTTFTLRLPIEGR
jgi:two-component system, NtrC family, sensor kinase